MNTKKPALRKNRLSCLLSWEGEVISQLPERDLCSVPHYAIRCEHQAVYNSFLARQRPECRMVETISWPFISQSLSEQRPNLDDSALFGFFGRPDLYIWLVTGCTSFCLITGVGIDTPVKLQVADSRLTMLG